VGVRTQGALPLPAAYPLLLPHICADSPAGLLTPHPHAAATALVQGRKLDAVRLPMYGALASYLTMCRGPALLRAPPPVVEALLAGMPAGSSSASQLDALQSQVGACFRGAAWLKCLSGMMKRLDACCLAGSVKPCMVCCRHAKHCTTTSAACQL
jgi:hypothetical protein